MDEKVKAELLANFKTYNSINTSVYDKLYKLYLDKAVQSLLNLTNRILFPKELQYIVLDMMNDFYAENLAKSNISDEGNNYIKQIEEDGRSVTFGNKMELDYQAKISSDINFRLELRKKEIYRYRLLFKEGYNGKD